jgi:hypothetical protein
VQPRVRTLVQQRAKQLWSERREVGLNREVVLDYPQGNLPWEVQEPEHSWKQKELRLKAKQAYSLQQLVLPQAVCRRREESRGSPQ